MPGTCRRNRTWRRWWRAERRRGDGDGWRSSPRSWRRRWSARSWSDPCSPTRPNRHRWWERRRRRPRARRRHRSNRGPAPRSSPARPTCPSGSPSRPGWEMLETLAVVKSGADPVIGVTFYDVANIYADGCRWELVDPPVGAGVEDLVAAYGKVEDLRASAARPVSVDGFDGEAAPVHRPGLHRRRLQGRTPTPCRRPTTPEPNTAKPAVPRTCGPRPRTSRPRASILDVDGTRLVDLHRSSRPTPRRRTAPIWTRSSTPSTSARSPGGRRRSAARTEPDVTPRCIYSGEAPRSAGHGDPAIEPGGSR